MTEKSLVRHASALWSDPWRGLDRCLAQGAPALGRVFLGMVLGWWLYVPLHELAHAAGCAAAGGVVTRLEIDVLYGGSVLARVFPFVVAGSDYAGRLSGFDTRGSDLVYLATDLAPYLLTLLPGLWALRRAAVRGRALVFGFWLPWAYAPVLSLTGDAYEIGSLMVKNLPAWSADEVGSRLVGDDLMRKLAELSAVGDDVPWLAFGLAILAGGLWAWSWMTVASLVATGLGQSPIPAEGKTLTAA